MKPANWAMGSTILRDWERCPEKARQKVESGFYWLSVGNHNINMAVGVAFDAFVRERIIRDTQVIPKAGLVERQLSWLHPMVRDEGIKWGKWFMEQYVASGAYNALLEEGVEDGDPEERDVVIDGVPVHTRPDTLLKVEGSRRVLDYKTSGLTAKNGATIKGGYVEKWLGGENTGPSRVKLEEKEGDTPIAHYMTQTGLYCLGEGPDVWNMGIDLLAVLPGRMGICVPKYRHTFSVEYMEKLKVRLLRAYADLMHKPDVAKDIEPTPSRCFAFGRPCEVADSCVAYQKWRNE